MPTTFWKMMTGVAAASAGLLTLPLLSVTTADAAVSPSPPHIVAQPNNLMVNTPTHLTGSGFQAASTITLKECGVTNWIAPRDPCDTSNAVTVTTNASGGFKTKFEVQLCPDGLRGPEPTSEICYIGQPAPSGIDTLHLVGAVKITVTYP